METKTVHSFCSETGEYIGTRVIQRHPGVGLPPSTLEGNLPKPGQNEVIVCENGKAELKPDHRGKVFWDTTTRQKRTINQIGETAAASWTNKEPKSWQLWNGTAWADDLELWKNIIVRPARDAAMEAFKWRIERYERAIRRGDSPVDDIKKLDEYMQALADLPATLNAFVDHIPWPIEP